MSKIVKISAWCLVVLGFSLPLALAQDQALVALELWEVASEEAVDVTQVPTLVEEESLPLLNGSKLVIYDSEIESAEFIYPGAPQMLGGPMGYQPPRIMVQVDESRWKDIEEYTGARIGKQLALVVRGQVVFSFSLEEPLMDGSFPLVGGWTSLQAEQIREDIWYGVE
ncbi:MAG: hypothetical protein JW937_03420 [Candidatus Omnitrophica bacterium]|nr:hypothetical protein [Candidatus Omnitrophota bacterium]